jgi:hypothetical protein
LLTAVAAQGQRNRDNDTEAAKRACGATECLYERDIRDFEVIDRTHLIVYAGSQRCAFHIELQGTFCDLTFAPELYFSRLNDVDDGRVGVDPFDPLNTTGRQRPDLRICDNDLSVQVHGGEFTENSLNEPSTDRFGTARVNCRVSSVTSFTDDQLVEFYVKRRVVPPLPPMGTGQIEVGEQEEEGGRGNDTAEERDNAD